MPPLELCTPHAAQCMTLHWTLHTARSTVYDAALNSAHRTQHSVWRSTELCTTNAAQCEAALNSAQRMQHSVKQHWSTLLCNTCAVCVLCSCFHMSPWHSRTFIPSYVSYYHLFYVDSWWSFFITALCCNTFVMLLRKPSETVTL